MTTTNRDLEFRSNGQFELRASKPWWLAWLLRPFDVYGGSAGTAPSHIPVVSLRETPQIRNGVATIHCPVPDFGAPTEHDYPMVRDALVQAFIKGGAAGHLFVGCGAGIGRTGMFLALMVKVLGEDKPVGWVRENYLRGAVETKPQFDYIEHFPVGPVRRALFWAAIRAWFNKGNATV